MNLAYRFPIIYWNCACLITDSGGAEYNEDEIKTTNYDKIATAIGKMRNLGINVSLPDINNSSYTFKPDEANNKILYGLRGITNVGDALVNNIMENRPYKSIKEFYYRVKPNKQAMVSLIKSGAFDELWDRKKSMAWYIWNTCDKKSRLTLQNMGSFIKFDMLPKETEEQIIAKRVYEFNRYLKSKCKVNSTTYRIDERAINFLNELNVYDKLVSSNNLMSASNWDKIYQKWMDVFREWLSKNKERLLDDLNSIIFMDDWKKYAEGSISKWEMYSLGFYYHEHELININKIKYGIRDFNNLPEEPIVEKTFIKGNKVINMYKLTKICGTCIAKNKAKGSVTLLTTTGVVNVRFRKEYFSIYDKQISKINPDGTKTVLEKSWFNKGNMIMVMGIRSGDDFIVKKYASSIGEQLYRIDEIKDNGRLVLRHERISGGIAEDVD